MRTKPSRVRASRYGVFEALDVTGGGVVAEGAMIASLYCCVVGVVE